MKTWLFLTLFFTGYCFGGEAQPAVQKPLSADSILKTAMAKAARENKNLLVMFKASWCTWCHKMDSSINDRQCKASFDDNYVICRLVVQESKTKKNLENPGAEDLFTKYSGPDLGLPLWLILDKNGNLLADSQIRKEGDGLDKKGENTGCPTAPPEVKYFISVLKKTSHMSGAELGAVEKRFLENEP